MKYTISTYIILAAVVSFFGWIVENVWLAFTKGYINNRNMTLPFLLGYGLFVLAVYFVLGLPGRFLMSAAPQIRKHKFLRQLLYFLLAAIFVSLGEVILGNIVEKLCGFEYWNYTALPLHLSKYTSVPTSMGFASIIMFVMDKLFVPIADHIAAIEPLQSMLIAGVVSVLLLWDFFRSFRKMYKERRLYETWRIQVRTPKQNRLRTFR